MQAGMTRTTAMQITSHVHCTMKLSRHTVQLYRTTEQTIDTVNQVYKTPGILESKAESCGKHVL